MARHGQNTNRSMTSGVTPIVAYSSDERFTRRMALLGGVSPLRRDPPGGFSEFVKLVERDLVSIGWAKPGTKIMTALRESNMITSIDFDEEIEWTWFYLWHHEGRRARHGASMMAPDYAHWHGMYEVAERFYMELIPMAREIAAQAAEEGDAQGAENVNTVIDEILARPEHEWFESMKKAKAEETASGLRARREGAESAGGG